jgi:glucosylglycerate phosphorylase
MLNESVQETLLYLYPEHNQIELHNKIETLIEPYRRSNGCNSGRREITEKDVFLITYGDSILSPGQRPLESLYEFLSEKIGQQIPNIHILPFYPYSSDDGFSVTDYFKVNRELGDWNDVEKLSEDYSLIFDGVINHISSESEWFGNYLKGDPEYKDYFIRVEPETDLSRVTRPRALPLLTEFQTSEGIQKVWTTFSEDQIDLNFRNPDVFLKILELIFFYIEKGARYLRLDAIGFLWKEIGTTCLHLPQTHRIIQLYRELVELVKEDFVFITETNVPHKDNISYFGNGYNEAAMVYQFPLPPLLLNAVMTENCRYLTGWAKELKNPSSETGFFNFLASHDGIGLNPVRGIIPESEIVEMADKVKDSGGLVSYKTNPDGSMSPYELNISLYNAIAGQNESEEVHIRKFILIHALQMSLSGSPAIYIHSLLGSANDYEGVRNTGRNRSINREKLDRETILKELENPESRRGRIFSGLMKLIEIRRNEKAFHPGAGQRVLNLGDSVFTLIRKSTDLESEILGLFNFSGEKEIVRNPLWGYTLIDSVSQEKVTDTIEMEPLSFHWLKIERNNI